MKNEGKNVKSSESGEDHMNWRYQDKAYNESFKNWRRQKQNSVGFYFVEKPGRFTYRDGVGFISDYPEAHEAKAFRRAIMILGLILVYRVAVDIFFGYLVPPIMEKLGMDIHYSFFGAIRSGNKAIMMAIDFSAQLLGRIVPTALLVKHLEIPFSVMLPMRITNKSMFGFAVPAAVFSSAVCAVMLYFYSGVLSAAGIDIDHSQFLSSGSEIILLQILIVPVISEICTHGVIMQFVRQFGDGTALCITSFIIAATTYDLVYIPYAAAMSFVIGYFIIRTGSVITGIIMRVTARGCVYLMSFLYGKAGEAYGYAPLTVFLLIALTAGLAFTIWFLCCRSDKFTMKIRSGYMSFGRKLMETATSVPMVIWFTLTFLATALNIKFKL